MTPSKKEGISTKLAATFSYRDVLLLCGDGSRTTSPSSDDHHSASKLTHLIKGNPIIRKNTKNSIQALPMNKISTKASASDSKNPKVFQKTTSFVAATPDAASIITKVTSVHQVKDKETRATDMMKKHTTISSSLDIVSKEEIIVPSNSVDKKKNDHLSSSTKEGTLALVSESSATSVVYVPDKVKTDVLMKMKKHTTISSSSLDNASDEIAPSTFVAKKNDHLSSSKEGTARVHDSSVTSKFHVEVKETEATDMMKMKKHNTISSSSLHIVSDEVISSTSIDKKNDHVPSAKKEGTARVYDSSAASKFHVEVKETEATHMMKMSKKHATISSSLDVVSKEMIVPSTFVDKKNDHLSFTKGGNALLVYDSSATFDPVVSTSPSVSTTSNKVDTAKILKIKKKQVETKKVKTSSTSSLFSDESKEKVLNKQVKIAAAPLLADESKVEIFHETEAPTKVLDDSGSNDSFLSSFHRKSSASISNKIFSRGKTYSFGFVKASKLFLASFLLIALFIPSCEASLVHKGSKLMGNLKAGDSSTLNEKSVEVSKYFFFFDQCFDDGFLF
ncbi:predicted protein [Chaetoceros tenuissimus]|uniref:Uncharacterized protein n=1 Tax=Chaetoceros tenuissimus TaxID=426638 RepID=A0AAD3CD49_9STRA|nr:predicted protein [Chaetoceros tenuissimus]